MHLNSPTTTRTVQVGGCTKAALLEELQRNAIASAPLFDDDTFPKGFYLRRIQGVLWLRGYRAGADHLAEDE